MPIEIRELYIKAVIDSGGGGKKPGDVQSGEENAKPAAASGQGADNLVDLCVEKVMEILQNKEER